MNEVEKCEFIYHAVVSLSCIFLSAQNMLKNQHVLLVTANCHHVLKSFQINCSICNKRSYWDDIGPFGGIKTDHVDLSIPSFSGWLQSDELPPCRDRTSMRTSTASVKWSFSRATHTWYIRSRMRSDGVVEPAKRDNRDDTWRVLSQNWCQNKLSDYESYFDSMTIIPTRKRHILPYYQPWANKRLEGGWKRDEWQMAVVILSWK